MLQRISVTPPLGDGRVRSRRCVPVADGTGVTRLNEAQCTATLLIAEIAGALVSEQRRFLRISPTASATHQAQLRLDLATVLRRPVLVGAARWRRQSHRLQPWMVRVLLQERLHQRARHLDLAAPFHVQRHQPIPVYAAAQTWSRYWKQTNRSTPLAASFLHGANFRKFYRYAIHIHPQSNYHSIYSSLDRSSLQYKLDLICSILSKVEFHSRIIKVC